MAYALPNDAEISRERHALLAATYDAWSFRRAEALGVGPGWRCLDVGAGAGSYARWLARRVGEDGAVVAADLDAQLIEPAGPLEVRELDVRTDELEEGAYDLVHTRLLLLHLPERDEVLPRLAAAVRPGGILLIEEDDGYPVLATGQGAYHEAWAAFLDMMGGAGVDPAWARTAPARLDALGFEDVEADISTQIFRGGSPPARFWSLTWLQVRERIAAREVVDAGRAELEDPTKWFVGPALVTAWGRRPG
jgi:SAM-dependent methyltransferase